MLKVGITGGIGSGKSTVCRLFAMLGIPVYDSDARAKVLMATDPALIAGITALFGPESYLDEIGLNGEESDDGWSDSEPGHRLNRQSEHRLTQSDSRSERRLNRRHIAAMAFSEKMLLDKLEALVHPAVLRDFAAWATALTIPPLPATKDLLVPRPTDPSSAAIPPSPGLSAPSLPPVAVTPPHYVLLESAILFESGFDRAVDKTILVDAPAQVRIERVVGRDGVSAQKVAERMDNQLPAEHAADFRIDNGGDTLLWPQVLDIDKALRELSLTDSLSDGRSGK